MHRVISPQIAALNKKRSEKTPEEIEFDKQRDLIRYLEGTRSTLGLFKGKEKKAITERLDTVERPKLEKIKERYHTAKQERLASIDAEIAELSAKGKELRDEETNLKKRSNEITAELTKDR